MNEEEEYFWNEAYPRYGETVSKTFKVDEMPPSRQVHFSFHVDQATNQLGSVELLSGSNGYVWKAWPSVKMTKTVDLPLPETIAVLIPDEEWKHLQLRITVKRPRQRNRFLRFLDKILRKRK